MVWERHSGPTPTEKTGPDNDHTYERYNNSGHYLFVNMNQHAMNDDKRKLSGFASNAVINSIVFNPPPYAHLNTSSIYQHSCLVCIPLGFIYLQNAIHLQKSINHFDTFSDFTKNEIPTFKLYMKQTNVLLLKRW